jgi:hypothetical protein
MLDDIADGLHAVPGVTVTVEAPAELTVTTNPGLLERILDNLARNAASAVYWSPKKLRTRADLRARTRKSGSENTI